MEPKYANDPSYVFNLVKMKRLLFALSCIWTLGAQGQAVFTVDYASQADVKAENLVQTIGAWSPKIAFPEAGDYVVLLNVGGPGGVDAGLLAVTVDAAASDGGCSTTGTNGGLATVALGGLALALRRRRA